MEITDLIPHPHHLGLPLGPTPGLSPDEDFAVEVSVGCDVLRRSGDHRPLPEVVHDFSLRDDGRGRARGGRRVCGRGGRRTARRGGRRSDGRRMARRGGHGTGRDRGAPRTSPMGRAGPNDEYQGQGSAGCPHPELPE
nr:hypothetical protein [Anaerolineae bacterium]